MQRMSILALAILLIGAASATDHHDTLLSQAQASGPVPAEP